MSKKPVTLIKVLPNDIPPKIREYQQELIENITLAEDRFLKVLGLVAKKIGFEFEFQAVYLNLELNKYYIVDFAIPFHKTIIEIDGQTHKEIEQKLLDKQRDECFKENGYRIVRIKNENTSNPIISMKNICKFLLVTRHTLKAYSLLKKIKDVEKWRKMMIEKAAKDIDKAFLNSINQIFCQETPQKHRATRGTGDRVSGKKSNRRAAVPAA